MIELKKINKYFLKPSKKLFAKKERVHILKDIDLILKDNTCLGILGESGSGKTTLGRIILGLLDFESGEILIDGRLVDKNTSKELRKNMSIIYQDYKSSVNPRFKIKDIIKEGLVSYEKKTKKKIDKEKKLLEYLELVNLSHDVLERYPHQLSGGQLQRVCIARTLATGARIILLDEAISSLDSHTQVQIMDLLIELKNKLKLTYLFISHDLMSVTYICDEFIIMEKGIIRERKKVEDINKLEDPYSKKLLDSVLDFTEVYSD